MRVILLLSLFFSTTSIIAQHPDDVIGVWLVENEDAYIKITKKQGKYFGTVTWLKEPYDKNGQPITDPEGREIAGMEIMKDFVFSEDEWVDGTVYDAETGKTYHGSIQLDGEDKLKLRGSLDTFGLIGRTATWTRLNTR